MLFNQIRKNYSNHLLEYVIIAWHKKMFWINRRGGEEDGGRCMREENDAVASFGPHAAIVLILT